jgi:capsid protein
MPRGWAWVDPLKDIQASVMAINNGLDTRTDVNAENGREFEEIVTTLAAEKALAAKLGLDFTAEKPTPAASGQADAPADPGQNDNQNDN